MKYVSLAVTAISAISSHIKMVQRRMLVYSMTLVIQFPKNWEEFCQQSIGEIRISVATSYDIVRHHRFLTNKKLYLTHTHSYAVRHCSPSSA